MQIGNKGNGSKHRPQSERRRRAVRERGQQNHPKGGGRTTTLLTLHRDSTIAFMLDLRRRSKAVLDVLDGMLRVGVSLSGSVELTSQYLGLVQQAL